jgi:hypothetical protein
MKKFKTIFIVSLLLVNFCAIAQKTDLVVSEGTGKSDYSPLTTAGSLPPMQVNQHTQIIYPENELTAMIGYPIQKITFHAEQVSAEWGSPTGTVKLMRTDANSLSGLEDVTDAMLVWTGTLALANNQLVFTFDESFEYTGGNLLVDITSTNILGIIVNFYGNTRDGASYWTGKISGMPGDMTRATNFLPKITFSYEIIHTFYTITATAGEHGSIAPEGNDEYEEGSTQTFTITPDAGYEIDTVLVNGNPVELAEDNTYTFEDISENSTISVTFKPIIYTLTYHNLNGVSNPNPSTYTIETPTISLLVLENITDSVFTAWYSNSSCTGSPVTAIELGSTGNKEFWAKWDAAQNGVQENTIQNVAVYAYMNTVYVENKGQTPLKSMVIMDMQGRVVYSSTSVQHAVTLDLAKGQYIVRLMSENSVFNAKVMIRN